MSAGHKTQLSALVFETPVLDELARKNDLEERSRPKKMYRNIVDTFLTLAKLV